MKVIISGEEVSMEDVKFVLSLPGEDPVELSWCETLKGQEGIYLAKFATDEAIKARRHF